MNANTFSTANGANNFGARAASSQNVSSFVLVRNPVEEMSRAMDSDDWCYRIVVKGAGDVVAQFGKPFSNDGVYEYALAKQAAKRWIEAQA